MKHSRRNIIIVCILAIIAGLMIWIYWLKKPEVPKLLLNYTPNPSAFVSNTNATIPSEEEIKQRDEQKWKEIFRTSIEIYGKVVDENGNPIPSAIVEININDRPFTSGSNYTKTTDEKGLFSIFGVNGIAFSATASKKGYYTTDESIKKRNVVTPTKSDAPQSLKNRPIILVLRKQGNPLSLIFTSSRQFDVPKTGQPLSIDLTTGRTNQGHLQVASWIGNSSQQPFDWRYQLSILGGGLIERKGQFDFEAPSEGYQESIEINMPATAQRWSSDVNKDYFAKLPDGRYARFSINFYPGKRNFIVLESYVNFTPGDRNLEYDPNKAVKSP